MNDEARRAAILRRSRGNQRIGVETGARFIGVSRPTPRRERRRRGANPEPGRGQGRRAGRAAAGSPARAAQPMSPRSWPASDRNQSPSHPAQASSLLPALAPKLQIASKADAIGRDMRAGLLQPEREAAKLPRQRPRQRRVVLALASVARPSGRAGIARPRLSSSVETSSFRTPAGKFDARAVTTTWPPLRRGMSFATSATAARSSTLSRIISHVGLDSSQRRTAVILVASSRASFSGRSRFSKAVSPAKPALSAAPSLALTNRSAE